LGFLLRSIHSFRAGADGAELRRFLPVLQSALELATAFPSHDKLPADPTLTTDGQPSRALPAGVAFGPGVKVVGQVDVMAGVAQKSIEIMYDATNFLLLYPQPSL
jgi:hypothetical protein